jgi:hypothetical protein
MPGRVTATLPDPARLTVVVVSCDQGALHWPAPGPSRGARGLLSIAERADSEAFVVDIASLSGGASLPRSAAPTMRRAQKDPPILLYYYRPPTDNAPKICRR